MKTLRDEAAELRQFAAESEAEAEQLRAARAELDQQIKDKLADASRARRGAYAMFPRGRRPKDPTT